MQVISVSTEYASGLRRLAAAIIDSLILGLLFSAAFSWGNHLSPWSMFDGPGEFFTGFFLSKVTAFALTMLYHAFMESSKYQGSMGKIALGIKVVDKNDHPIEFSKALLRNMSKLISAFILCIGYIMIIFDARKQGLHDKIAETFVVKQ